MRLPMWPNKKSDAGTRSLIADVVVFFSLFGIAAVSGAALWLTDDRPGMARLVFVSILALLGTWVGTVLAFYFMRDNMSAATDNTARLLGLRSSTPVTEVMVPKARMIFHVVAPGADARTVKLGELYQTMRDAHVARIPVLDASGAVLYVFHKSTIDAFSASLNPPKKPETLTEDVHALLGNSDLERMVEAIGFVRPGALIVEARKKMRSIPGCNDVFVTSSGAKTDPVIGWLTDTDLAMAE
jgi:hypothetical protein